MKALVAQRFFPFVAIDISQLCVENLVNTTTASTSISPPPNGLRWLIQTACDASNLTLRMSAAQLSKIGC